MFRFIHSADWQLGARFSQFGPKASRLRQARLITLRRALDLARQHDVDAFIVAGDLFEDNLVDEELVVSVVDLFREYSSVPIYLLPGNHDPFTGPDSVWKRRPFLDAPAHIHLLLQQGAIDLNGVCFLSSPLCQKVSTVDPSSVLAQLASTVPENVIKVGITHGSLAIETKHKPNDFPISLDAASRAGLDYLAVGHWHNWLASTDGGRIVMPGTPEPDRFSNDASGRVALVEIAGPGLTVHVEPLFVATLIWRELTFDCLALETSRITLESKLAELAPRADCVVLRIILSGTASPADLVQLRSWLEAALIPFLVGQILDCTRIALNRSELAELQARHPILAQVLADIDQMETLATGTVAPSASKSAAEDPAIAAPLSLTEAQALLGPSKIDLYRLSPEFFSQLRQILFQALQDATK